VRFCLNCDQLIKPVKKFNTKLFIILLVMAIIPGLLYLFVYSLTQKRECPMCGSKKTFKVYQASKRDNILYKQ
jgi:cell division protein YceG involved in septum cleavage